MKPSLIILTASILFSSCATLPKNFQSSVSTSVSQTESSELRRLTQPEVAAHPGKSGIQVLNTGREAFLSRLALAETAERTIDCQYFIWEGDRSGVILLDRLVKAADRGVRVRLLLDDMTSHGKDLGLAALNQHPHIEIRLFNPLGRRYYIGLFRTMSMAFHVGRMTNRMHNKLFVTDNQAAILGGRNIGDEYFGIDKRSNFRDMDLLVVGPVVADISSAFDAYWNSPWSVPFEVFRTQKLSEGKLKKKSDEFHRRLSEMEKLFPYPLDRGRDKILKIFSENKSNLMWADTEVVSDPPGKAWQQAERGKSNSEIVNKLENLISQSAKDILVASPYFIISSQDVAALGRLEQRGLSVRVLTNSLISTDAVPVVAMYRKIRKPMLQAGVDVYEIRADAQIRKKYSDPSADQARLSLHAKAVIFDREKVFIGTFNIDPRSEHLNTEVGLLVRSTELAQKISGYFEEDLLPQNSYRLRIDEKKRQVEWVCEEKGKPKIYSSDPEAGFWLKFEAGFFGFMPISGQL